MKSLIYAYYTGLSSLEASTSIVSESMAFIVHTDFQSSRGAYNYLNK